MRLMVARDGQGTALYFVEGEEAYRLTGQAGFNATDLSGAICAPVEKINQIVTAAKQAAPQPVESLIPALPFNQFGKILCLGLNYVDHVKEGGYEIPTYPAMFIRFPASMIPAGAPMIKPDCSDRLDYEVELMIVIGKGGRHISEEDALSHVFGYTVFNDGSVRDYQRKTHQWTPGKNFDATGAVGPVVVTADKLPPGAAGLNIVSRLNGNVMQSANTADMMWSVAKTIATVSEFTTLEPGDLIATGTPPGVGHARTPPVFLVPGDTVEVEIENICTCVNPIVSEGDAAGKEAAA
ncbi:fumarylacetoacetate hydrolase family protein [Hoeflea prorocentri]|uniref:Fumarylacetoacetate hydrolase family protein n=1 Tax=Hoeflea prorocentri TaxID=1922333 RepID=A0A9X3UIJ8_9HYPH|nr:fumarylacetoacetate hydrolase family protein [Hoeflea prorocentri]MCY6381992.1 fumarylacetoacetate hydrolase family protein [Hoeflea prorocentri]MDA5399792.1 fumarylacetoacetate hydrolase family protein [Hoeflea prorocentri]